MSDSLYRAEVLRDTVDRVATDPETASVDEIRDVATTARRQLDEQIRSERLRRMPSGQLGALVHDAAWAADDAIDAVELTEHSEES